MRMGSNIDYLLLSAGGVNADGMPLVTMRYFLQTFGKHIPAPKSRTFFLKLIPAENFKKIT